MEKEEGDRDGKVRGERRRGRNEQEGKRRGPPRVGSHPRVRNPEKYPDCRTDLIGGGGNTDVLFALGEINILLLAPGGKHPRSANGSARRIIALDSSHMFVAPTAKRSFHA